MAAIARKIPPTLGFFFVLMALDDHFLELTFVELSWDTGHLSPTELSTEVSAYRL